MSAARWWVLLVSVAFESTLAFAYEIGTHARISFNALNASSTAPTAIVDELDLPDGINMELGPFYFDISADPAASPYIRKRFESFDSLNGRMPPGVVPTQIEGWLLRGTLREDDGTIFLLSDNPFDDPLGQINRFCNHFYDPVYNAKLSNYGCMGSDLTSAPIWAFGVQEPTSTPGGIVTPMPPWIPDPYRRNHYSIQDAREAEWRALTLKQFKDTSGALQTDPNTGALLELPAPQSNPNDTDTKAVFSTDPVEARDEYQAAYFATLFRTLGDILHVNQDMAQPQHTRPEVHPRIWPGRGFYEAYIESRALKDTGKAIYQENFAPFGVSVASLQPLAYSPTTIPTFANYSDFWSTTPGGNVANGLGMADYSNRGFFTPAHNLDESSSPTYILPSNDPSSYTPSAFQSSDGATWRYLDGTVPDSIRGSGDVIHLTRQTLFVDAATDAGLTPPTGPEFTLDRTIYDDYASLLLPRAVAYSAGLLDYFFRGSMQVNLPDAGFYAIVDDAQFAPGQPNTPTDVSNGFHGFGKLKLKLLNTTPDITTPDGTVVQQDMSGGTLVAVLAFHRNTCYDDLLVNWPANNAAAIPCRSPDPEIVVSNPVTNQAVPTASQAPNGIDVTFTFAEKELPINAWDVRLKVVYRGQLGSEPDAVVAVTQNISEPTFVTFMNFTDYVLLNGKFYTPADLAQNHQDLFADVTPACRSGAPGAYTVSPSCYNITDDFTFTAGSSTVTIAAAGATAIAPRRIARVAMLTDVSVWPSLTWQQGSVTCWTFLSDPLQLQPYSAETLPDGTFSYIDPTTLRGVSTSDGEFCYSDIGINQTPSGSEDRSTMTDPLQNPTEITPAPLTITGW